MFGSNHMVKSVGYYTTDSCVAGWPEQPDVYPFQDGTVQTELLHSGHYATACNGRINSVHFPIKPVCEQDNAKPLIVGTAADILLNKDCSLEAWSDECSFGLQSFVRIQTPCTPPIYVFDQHNFAFFAWEEARTMGYINEGAALVHIDAHSDTGKADVPNYDKLDLAAVAEYTRKLGIATFIHPALVNGTVGEYWDFHNYPLSFSNEGHILAMKGVRYEELRDLVRYDECRSWFKDEDEDCDCNSLFACNRYGDQVSTTDLSTLIYNSDGPKRLILDVDLDAFIPTAMDLGFKRRQIASGMGIELPPSEMGNGYGCPEAAESIAAIADRFGMIDLATSPGFADQNEVVICARQIVSQILDVHQCE